jgi:NAD(P)-dependent dehydrogenase (short-subunit alcohol dehydrogenase family)
VLLIFTTVSSDDFSAPMRGLLGHLCAHKHLPVFACSTLTSAMQIGELQSPPRALQVDYRASAAFAIVLHPGSGADHGRWMFSVNLDSAFLGTKYAIPPMKGSIISISSIKGIVADTE